MAQLNDLLVLGKSNFLSPAIFTNTAAFNQSVGFNAQVNFANGTWNMVGDDVMFGDQNIAGAFCLKGNNDTTSLVMVQRGGTAQGKLAWSGSEFIFYNTVKAEYGLYLHHCYWKPAGNLYCLPTDNNQEWSVDVGSDSYTGAWWHVWSARNGCSMLACYSDTNEVKIPNGKLSANQGIYVSGQPVIVDSRYIHINGSNPYIGLTNTADNTVWYYQAHDYKVGLGPTWANAVKWDASGNQFLAGYLSAKGKVNSEAGFRGADIGLDDSMTIIGQSSNEVNFGGTGDGTTIYFGYRGYGTKAAPSNFSFGAHGGSATIIAGKVKNAVWNDYAECRSAESIEPGRVVIEDVDGVMKISSERLQPGGNIISDTYGSIMGETDDCKTPIAVAGRVLAYTHEDRNSYPLGAAVCTGPNGTVSLMTREEIREYPERIIGTVSEIPNYETWGTGNVEVNGRIWIKVK